MKKQIGLLAIIALLVSFMAFSGVASAQASNVTVTFFTSPFCSACQASAPGIQSAAATHGATLVTYDVTTDPGKGIATANAITTTPTVIVSGSQTIVLTGAVSEAQVGSAIEKVTPTKVATPTVKPTATPIVKATPTPTVKPTATPIVKATPTPTVKPTATPTIEVVTATPTTKTTTATVPEFSVLGLGAPALLVGAIYLFLRKR